MAGAPAGYYKIFSRNHSESGCLQKNESSFINIKNATNPSGIPKYVNCTDQWVSVDPGNKYFGCAIDGVNITGHGLIEPTYPTNPHPWNMIYHYMGTFWIEPGDNDLEVRHACSLLMNSCPVMVHPDQPCAPGTRIRPDGSTGNVSGTPQSTKFDHPNQFCLIPE